MYYKNILHKRNKSGYTNKNNNKTHINKRLLIDRIQTTAANYNYNKYLYSALSCVTQLLRKENTIN